MEEGLDGGEIAEAFPRREVVGHDDLLEVFVGEVVDVGLPRQPPAQSAIGVLDAALLPGSVSLNVRLSMAAVND